MNTVDRLLLAGYIRGQTKRASAYGGGWGDFSAGAWNKAKRVGGAVGRGLGTAADWGSYAIPGVGTARMGYDAIKAFGQGNILGGIGNTIGAGVSLIPGGGFVGRGIGAGAKMLGRGLMRAGAPTAGAAVRLGGRSLKSGLNTVNESLGKVPGMMSSGAQSVAKTMPTFGGNAVASGIKSVGGVLGRHPTMTQVGSIGPVLGLNAAGAGVQESKALATQQASNMQGMMQNWRSRMPSMNPMTMGGGQNPNFQFA